MLGLLNARQAVNGVSSELMGTEAGTLQPEQVRRMFDRIAPVYDVMNRAMTAGLDRRWRRLAAEAVVQPGDLVLDACCGTGELARAAEAAGGRVTGVDFSESMMERARRKSTSIEWTEGDLLDLPFGADSFDAATIGFGIRNARDLDAGLRELARVLKPDGRLACLEITRPQGVLRPFFRLWFETLIPLAGRVLPGGSAYTYLPASVRRLPGPQELGHALERAGFGEVRWRLLGGGIISLHVAVKSSFRDGPRRRAAMGECDEMGLATPSLSRAFESVDTGATEDAAACRPARPGDTALHRGRSSQR